MPRIIKLEPTPVLPAQKRVAAYARVSVETGRTMNSLSAQVSYYNTFIQQHPEWEYAGVYADNGESGTSKQRSEFQRLLADCEAGKVDLIITKSISRFARNTVDLLTVVRRLKELGVAVWFEEQNIDSLSGDGELMLSILASFAQSEVQSLSDNTKWAIQKRFAEGKPNGKFRIFGYQWQDDRLVIVPEEAAIIRRIYENFLAGKSRLETERELEAEGSFTRLGCTFKDSNLKAILTNTTYTGNLLFQKEYIADPISGKRKKNRGELPQFFVPDTHEAIIDPEVFEFVQSEMARRKGLGHFANKALNLTCFTSKIKCGSCDRSYVRSTRVNHAEVTELGDKLIGWVCSATKHKGGRCPVRKEIPERILKAVCAEVLNLPEFDETAFSQRVDQVVVPAPGVLVFHFTDCTTATKTWVNTAKKDSWTPERRAQHSEMLRKREFSPEAREARSEWMKAYWARRKAGEAAGRQEAGQR